MIDIKNRKLIEFEREGKSGICLYGFYDYIQFREAIEIYKREFDATSYNSSAGFFDSASCMTRLEGIELQWKFDNWTCIEITYPNLKDEIVLGKVRKWADVIFTKLVETYGEYDNS